MDDAAPSGVKMVSTVRVRFGLHSSVLLDEGHEDVHQDLL